jgi:hypothetical protein
MLGSRSANSLFDAMRGVMLSCSWTLELMANQPLSLLSLSYQQAWDLAIVASAGRSREEAIGRFSWRRYTAANSIRSINVVIIRICLRAIDAFRHCCTWNPKELTWITSLSSRNALSGVWTEIPPGAPRLFPSLRAPAFSSPGRGFSFPDPGLWAWAVAGALSVQARL